MVTGDRYEVDGAPDVVEATIVGAARDRSSRCPVHRGHQRRPLSINPDHVVALHPGQPD